MIYSDCKTSTKIQLAFRLVFCLRRVIFVGTILIWDRTPTYQLLSLLYFNLGMIHYISDKPLKGLNLNRIEMFNEFMMSAICQMTIVATNYLPDEEKKYEGAWVMIIAITFTFAVNIMIVIGHFCYHVRLLFIKYIRRITRYFNNKMKSQKKAKIVQVV